MCLRGVAALRATRDELADSKCRVAHEYEKLRTMVVEVSTHVPGVVAKERWGIAVRRLCCGEVLPFLVAGAVEGRLEFKTDILGLRVRVIIVHFPSVRLQQESWVQF